MVSRKQKVLLVAYLAANITVVTGFSSQAADAQSGARPIERINKQGSIAPLAETWENIPEAAAVAVKTQEWHGKALANTDGEAFVLTEAKDGSEAAGKIYKNTKVNVLEKNGEWSKISSGALTGYVKNETIVTGKEAVDRAKAVCPEGAQENAKTMEQIQAEIAAAEAAREAAEEAARKAAEEAARKEAEEEARRQAEEARKQEALSQSGAVSVSASDQALMAALIFCEAGNQPYDGQVAVGAVILNRVRSGSYPNTIRGVIYQSGQFGPAITGKLDRVLSSGSYTNTAVQAAADALAGSNPIGNCLYFGNGNYGQKIGDHYFH